MMRISARKVLQIVCFGGCLIFVNLCYTILLQGTHVAHTEKAPNPKKVLNSVQNGGDTVTSDRSKLDPTLLKKSVVNKDLDKQLVERDGGSIKHPNEDDKQHDNAAVSSLHKTELRDIFVSVKTTAQFHDTRVALLLDTWFNIAKSVTYFFTDADDPTLSKKTGDHVINTNCSSVHNRHALCCKMSVEFDYYLASNKRWFCHVDDDTYVHVAGLLKLLQGYNHTGDWYLGRPSLAHPMEVRSLENPGTKTSFWFATGGAGFCLSRGLALKMVPYAGGGKLKTVCDQIRLPDDCTVGYVVYEFLKKELKVIQQFHSHLEGLHKIKNADIEKHITFSYGPYQTRMNTVQAFGFNETYDPTRFRSIHCRLYPTADICKTLSS